MSNFGLDRYIKVPIDQAIKPIDGFANVLLNRWWPVTPTNEILLFGPGRSPQCNANRTIALRVSATYPFQTVLKQLPIVYLPHNCGDYR